MITLDVGHQGVEAICADPHDLATRLIYADYLEDIGEHNRSSFIRVQCELASLLETTSEMVRGERVECCECVRQRDGWVRCRWCKIRHGRAVIPALRRRERELLLAGPVLDTQWTRWHEGIEATYCLNLYQHWKPVLEGIAITFRRGFIEQVVCRCEDWLKHGPAIVRAQPVLEVRLTDLHEETIRCFGDVQENAVAWARHEADLPPLENKP